MRMEHPAHRDNGRYNTREEQPGSNTAEDAWTQESGIPADSSGHGQPNNSLSEIMGICL